MKGRGIKTSIEIDSLIVTEETIRTKCNDVLVTPNDDKMIALVIPEGLIVNGKLPVIIFSKVLLKSVRTASTPVVVEQPKQYVNNQNYNSGYNRESPNGYRARY